MFGFFRKKRPETEPGQGSSITAKQFIALTLSDEKLSMPVYLPGIRNEDDCEDIGLGPLIISGMWIVPLAHSASLLTVKRLVTSLSHLCPEITPHMLRSVMRK